MTKKNLHADVMFRHCSYCIISQHVLSKHLTTQALTVGLPNTCRAWHLSNKCPTVKETFLPHARLTCCVGATRGPTQIQMSKASTVKFVSPSKWTVSVCLTKSRKVVWWQHEAAVTSQRRRRRWQTASAYVCRDTRENSGDICHGPIRCSLFLILFCVCCCKSISILFCVKCP